MLDPLGLDADAEAVYRALLARPRAGAAEIGALLGLPEYRVDVAMATLARLALARPSREDDGRLRPVPPELGLPILLSRQQAELAVQQQRLESSRAAAARIVAEYAESRPRTGVPDVELLDGLDRTADRLAALAREVTREVLVLAPGAWPARPGWEVAGTLGPEVVARGVALSVVQQDSIRNHPPTLAAMERLVATGARVRTAPTLPGLMVVADRGTAILPVDPDDVAAGAVVLTGATVLTALCALFDAVWSGAQPLSRPHVRDANGLTAQMQAVLELLAEGHTDESIAKRLAVSPRTARRMATEVIERLGARSRFQAGVKAAQKHWLPDA